MFGEETLDFDDFFLAYKSYFYYMMKQGKLLDGELRVPIEARAAVRENSITFQQVLQWGRVCKASKDIDRINGLLGLLQRCGDGNPIDALPSILAGTVDDERQLSEVYWEIVLTYRPLKDTSNVEGDQYRSILASWVDFAYGSARSYSCPFSRQSLQHAVSKPLPTSCEKKAHTALQIIELCTSAMMVDVQIRINAVSDADYSHSRKLSWLAMPGPRQLWSKAGSGDFRHFQLLLAALFIEADRSRDIDENDEYQAVYMGLKMLESERREAAWKCKRPIGVKGLLEPRRSLSFECQVSTDPPEFQELPCSLNLATSSASPFQETHQCETQDRYLAMPSKGWEVRLEN